MATSLHYRDGVYRVEGGSWRGPDGHVVHLLTWITDDLQRLAKAPRGATHLEDCGATHLDDGAVAIAVAERLGSEAEVVVDGL